jgi:2-keto-4-pentenoate hydratase/2-oxohepta-3-ene-1,7-dioic acid hydratase in catechol pathway
VRLVTYGGGFGRVEDDRVVPMGGDLVGYLRTGEARDGAAIPLSDVTLLAPVPRPEKVIGVGLNYRDHAAESGTTIPDEPVLFAMYANSVVGPGAEVVVPAVAAEPDFEAELGVVIGRRARDVGEPDALAHVAGYTCMNDVSARDLQRQSSQWMLGKAIDTFLPCGPWLVTADEIPDPQALSIRCCVNGELMQDSSTANMAFGVASLVAFISRTITLEPGDLIATGTPPGVGMARTPPRWLRDGDEMTVEIERIGSLTNVVRRAGRTGGAG